MADSYTYNAGSVHANVAKASGVVGYVDAAGTVLNSYNIGAVTGTKITDAVVIEGTDAIVYSRGVDPIEITASKNDVVKTIALKVTTLYEDIILGDSEIICVDETTNEITLTATEERIEGVTYSWSDGDNVVGDDYELTLNNLNLEHIPIQ